MIYKQVCGALALALLPMAALSGCKHEIAVDPIKIEPIDITLHIYLEADKKLDSFFGDMGQPAKPPTPPTSPATESDKKEGAPS